MGSRVRVPSRPQKLKVKALEKSKAFFVYYFCENNFMKYLQLASLGKRSYLHYSLTLIGIISIFVFAGQFAYTFGMSLVGIPNTELSNYTLAQSQELMGANLFLIITLLPFVTLFFTMLLAIKFIHKRPILSVFTARPTFDWKREEDKLLINCRKLIFFKRFIGKLLQKQKRSVSLHSF